MAGSVSPVAIDEVSVDELASALDAGARVFDVREPHEYTEGHVPGAVLVPLGTVDDHVDEFRGEGPTVRHLPQRGRSMRGLRGARRARRRRDQRRRGHARLDRQRSGGRRRGQPCVTHRWIAETAELDAFVDRLLDEPRYALDTEFHRERTYFPKLALLQLASSDEIVLVDPTTCDMAPLRRLFAGPPLAVLHAAQQDLDVLTHAVRRGAGAAVRHAAGRRLPRLQHAVAGLAAVGRAEGHRGQGRPAHRLVAPPAHRGAVRLRRRRRRLPAGAARRARGQARRARPARSGWPRPARSCAPGRSAARTRTAPGCGSRRCACSSRGPAAWPAPWPPGANGGRWPATSRCVRCSPIWPCSACPRSSRAR